jgi:hypothetical protein
MHLENIPKLACNIPLVLAQLVLPQFHITIAGDGIDSCNVLDGKVEHVKGRVLSGGDVAGNHALSKFKVLKNGKPLG